LVGYYGKNEGKAVFQIIITWSCFIRK